MRTHERPESRSMVYVSRPGGYAVIFSAEGQIALVSTRHGLVLPGGGQNREEPPEAAAMRETAEECGLLVRLGARIGTADELVFDVEEQTHYRKRCTFFLAEVTGQSFSSERDHELVWLSPREAAATVRCEKPAMGHCRSLSTDE